MMAKLTHAELNVVAVRWLRRQKCGIVLSEIRTAASMVPDAIGWRHGRQCLLIECKTTVGDLRDDRHKLHVRARATPGEFRWYLTPSGMVADPLSLPAEWGLLEVDPNGVVREVKRAPRTEGHLETERTILCSALRRWQAGSHGWDPRSARFTRRSS